MRSLGKSYVGRLAKRWCGGFCTALRREARSSCYGAADDAFQRSTTDAVVVVSVFLNPGTGSCE